MKINRMILRKILPSRKFPIEIGLPDITDAEGSVLEFQKKTYEEDVPSTQMVTEIPSSASICAQRNNKKTGKKNCEN